MIIRELEKHEKIGGDYVRQLRQFLYQCSCSNLFKIDSRRIKAGNTLCKDCLSSKRSEIIKKINKTHGMSKTRIYKCWAGMKYRCNDKSCMYYDYYGGRGISYDKRWEDFINFYEDMKSTYADNLELDRIDVNKDYSKDNCRWVSESMQGYNQSIRSTNTSGRTGVYFDKKSKLWRAEIMDNGVKLYSKGYKNFEDACEFRRKEEIRIYGFTKDAQPARVDVIEEDMS